MRRPADRPPATTAWWECQLALEALCLLAPGGRVLIGQPKELSEILSCDRHRHGPAGLDRDDSLPGAFPLRRERGHYISVELLAVPELPGSPIRMHRIRRRIPA